MRIISFIILYSVLIGIHESQAMQVIINEFMKEPPSGQPEYIELLNTSDSTINLKDWKIGDSKTVKAISMDPFSLEGNSFIVITDDSASFVETFGPSISFVEIRSLPALNNGGDQIRLFDSLGVLSDSLEYDSDWGGKNIAIERRDTKLELSIFKENWGNSPSLTGGSPGVNNLIEKDTSAPFIKSHFFSHDDLSLYLIFNERITETDAESLLNYELLSDEFDLPTLIGVEWFSPDTVRLDLERTPEVNSEFALEINDIRDLFGNTAESRYWVEYYRFDSAVTGEVIINEFLYDPYDDISEYIELYHTSNDDISENLNLQNWTINDNSGNRITISDDTLKLEPNEYLVLAPDSSVFTRFPNARLISLRSRFPSLNNSGDDIVIRNENGLLIDSLSFNRAWGGSEVALERRSINSALSIYPENWGDSPTRNLGSPGSQNKISADSEAPEIVTVDFYSDSAIRLTYSERVDEDIAKDDRNYEFSPAVSVSFLSVDVNEIIFFLAEPLIDEQQYSITIQTQEDIFRNIAETTTESITYIEFSKAERDSVVINEFLYRSADGTSPEFIELFNNSSKNYDLSDWIIEDGGGNDASIPQGTILKSGSYIVFTDQEEFAYSIPNGIFLPRLPSLNDNGDEIVLRNISGVTIDSLFYDRNWGGSITGISVERKNPKRASNDADNWISSDSESGTSAGIKNPAYEKDEIPPYISFAKLVNENRQVEVVFNEFIRLHSNTEFRVFGSPANIANFDESNGNVILLDVLFDEDSNEGLNVNYLIDVTGNVADDQVNPVAFPLLPNSILFNEIMFDPIADNKDNRPDQTEYVEIFNTSNRSVSLEGIYLSDAPNEEGELNSIMPIDTRFRDIPSGGVLLIYAENETEHYSESRLAEFFEDDLPSRLVMRVDRSSLSLSSSGDAIFLRDSLGTVIDSVFYNEEWHNPNRYDTDGVSLEKIYPTGSSSDPNNWSSSVEIMGGTPGRKNSIFQNPGSAPSENDLELTPNPFSPSDQDGFEDNLFINYRLDAPDYAVTVTIYDRYGREVRKLTDGEFLPQNGTLIWDGFRDDGSINRVGRYIILFEARNNANGKAINFKRTVVIARR